MSKTHHPREGGSLAPPRPPAAKTPSPSCVSSSSSSSSRPSSFSSSTSPPLPSSPPFSSLPIRGRERHPSSRHTAPRPETSSSHTSPSSSSYSSSSSSPSSGSSLSSSPSSSPRERQRFFPPHSSSSSHPKHRQDSLSRSAEKSSHSHHPRTVSASTREVKTGEGRKSVQFTPPSPTTSSHSFPSDEGISKSVVHEAVPAELRGSSPPSPVRTSVYVTTRPFPSSSAKRDVAGMSSSSPTPGGWRRRGGEGRDGRFSPRLPCSKDGEPSSLDQVYIRRQRDGSMVMYLSAHLDKYLLRVFRTVSYNGFLTELRWVNMCIRAQLYPKTKDPDLLKYIFRGVAKNQLVIEYDQFLQLIHRLARYKFRKFKHMNDEDAVNAVLVHLFKMGDFTLENHVLRDCGIQVTPETKEVSVGRSIPLKEVGIDVKPEVRIAAVQMAPDLRETAVVAEPSVQTVAVETVPTGVEAFAQTDPKKPCKDTEVQCELLKPPPKNAESTTQTVDESKGSSGVQTDTSALEDKHTETAFNWRTWPNLRKCLALEGGDESDLFKVFCCYSDYDPEQMQNMMTEKACALLCKDSNMMEIPYHPEDVGIPPEQARLVYREVLICRPPSEPLHRARRSRGRRSPDHRPQRRLSPGGGRRDPRGAASSSSTEGGPEGNASTGIAAERKGETCDRAVSTTTTPRGGDQEGGSAAADDDDDDGLSTVGTEAGVEEEEADNRITYIEFKAVLYYLGQLLYDTLKPRSAFLKTVRENVVLNFFKRHKNIYVAFLGSQYTGDERGGGEGMRGRRNDEYELRTSSDAFPLLPRSARKSAPTSKPSSAAAFAGYETSMKSPRDPAPPTLSSSRGGGGGRSEASAVSNRRFLSTSTGTPSGGALAEDHLDEDYLRDSPLYGPTGGGGGGGTRRGDLEEDYGMMSMMPPANLPACPPPSPSPYMYGLGQHPMYPVSFNPAAPAPTFPILPSQIPPMY